MVSENPDYIDKQLIIRSDQIDPQTLQKDPILSLAKFSADLPKRLMELNEALRYDRPKIRSVSIEMIPGKIPILSTGLEYHGGWKVYLNAFPQRFSASIDIKNSSHLTEFWVTVEDIKRFTTQNFPEQETILKSPVLYEHILAAKEIVDLEDFKERLDSVTNDSLRDLSTYQIELESKVTHSKGVTRIRPHTNFEVLLDKQETPLFIFHTLMMHDDLKTAWCSIYSI